MIARRSFPALAIAFATAMTLLSTVDTRPVAGQVPTRVPAETQRAHRTETAAAQTQAAQPTATHVPPTATPVPTNSPTATTKPTDPPTATTRPTDPPTPTPTSPPTATNTPINIPPTPTETPDAPATGTTQARQTEAVSNATARYVLTSTAEANQAHAMQTADANATAQRAKKIDASHLRDAATAAGQITVQMSDAEAQATAEVLASQDTNKLPVYPGKLGGGEDGSTNPLIRSILTSLLGMVFLLKQVLLMGMLFQSMSM